MFGWAAARPGIDARREGRLLPDGLRGELLPVLGAELRSDLVQLGDLRGARGGKHDGGDGLPELLRGRGAPAGGRGGERERKVSGGGGEARGKAVSMTPQRAAAHFARSMMASRCTRRSQRSWRISKAATRFSSRRTLSTCGPGGGGGAGRGGEVGRR